MRGTGRIVSWNDEKGFGFISPLAGGNQVFVHIKAFSNRSRRPEVDQIVTYSIAKDAQGRPCAARVTFAGDRDERKVLRDSITAPIVIALVFLAAVGLSAMMGYLPGPVGLAYAALRTRVKIS